MESNKKIEDIVNSVKESENGSPLKSDKVHLDSRDIKELTVFLDRVPLKGLNECVAMTELLKKLRIYESR